MSANDTATYRWLRTGNDVFAAMLQAIQSASISVRLEMYIFSDCAIGQRFRAELLAALRRGVRVQVMVDAIGSRYLSGSFFDPLVAAGGECKWFNPLSLRRFSSRDHRKICVCDDRVAFVGGFNIASEYEGDGVTGGWHDLGLAITGPLVGELADTFDAFFTRAEFKHKRLQRLRKAPNRITSGQNWQLLLSGPGRRHTELRQTLARDFASAQSIKIISAYFLPTWRLRRELLEAAKRGAQVQLVLAGRTDVKLSQLASRRLYRTFLRAGVEIYEYQPQILHVKLIIVDDIVYAGSANLDTRSLRINYELLVRLSDPRLAAEAREIFAADLVHCRRIDPEMWRTSRTFLDKLQEKWAYFVLARVDPYVAWRQFKTLR
jgi:cardiolipin synthase